MCLRDELRSATQDVHNAMHAWRPALVLQSSEPTEAAYREFLLYMAPFVISAEEGLQGFLPPPFHRSRLLLEDLAELGLDKTLHGLRAEFGAFEPSTIEQQLGLAYVMLGSSVGNRLLCQQLAGQPWPRRFLQSGSGQAWRWLQVEMARPLSEGQRWQVVASAVGAFLRLQRWLFGADPAHVYAAP